MTPVRPLQSPAARLFVLVIGVVLIGAAAASAQQQRRLLFEAQAIFQALNHGSGRCSFDRAWDSRPVAAETGRRHLKLRVHADLVVSEPPALPMQIIDPAGSHPDAFCTADDRNAAWRAIVEAIPDQGNDVLRLISVSYGFPVFNADYTRAALMVQQFSQAWRRTADGALHSSLEMAGGAEIYAKRGRVWRRIAYDSYYTAH